MTEIQQLVRPNILTLEAYSCARQEFTGQDGIFLDANENPFGRLNRYPDPLQFTLKERLSKRVNIPTDSIFVGNGSDEAIDLAFRIFCDPGKHKALSFAPSYGMYKVSAAINGVEFLELPLDSEFQIDCTLLAPYLNDPTTRLLFLCSPNNPTGNLIQRSAITWILENFKGIVFLDEAYMDFSDEESALALLKTYDRLIVCQTFSKSRGLAGARVGVAYSSPEIIDFFNKVKPPYNVSQLNQQAAIEALQQEGLYRQQIRLLIDERKCLESALGKFKGVTKVYPSSANFLLVEVENAPRVYQELVERNIIVRNRSSQIRNCLRLTIGKPEENQLLLQTLQTIL